MRENELPTLYATLAPEDVAVLRPIIKAGQSVGLLSANKLLSSLQTQGINAPVFKPLRDYLAFVEEARSQTYLIDRDITIGIGLDLTKNNPAAKSLFYAVDPNRNWDFATLFTQQYRPVPALTSVQIDQLLCYSLIGTNNQEGVFHGYIQQLIARLGSLADAPLSANQLISLLSLLFNAGPGVIGPHVIQSLKDMLQSGNDLEPLQQIVEYSNKAHSSAVQNRRLRDAAIFHGNAVDPVLDVHITWRQYQRILNVQEFTLKGGPVKWGIPKGNDQETFRGYPNITIFPSGNPILNYNDPTLFGTPQKDSLAVGIPNYGAPVFFGGSGNDTITVAPVLEEQSTRNIDERSNFYLAGGIGYDIYNITLVLLGSHFIYDSDRVGNVVLSLYPFTCNLNKLLTQLSGPIVNDQLSLCPDIYFNATFQKEADGSNTLLFTSMLNTGEGYINITIGNFSAGQFGILPGGVSNTFPFVFGADVGTSAISVTGNFVTTSGSGQSTNFVVYDINGRLLNTFNITDFFSYFIQNFVSTYSGAFYASGVQKNLKNDTLFASVIDGRATSYKLQPIDTEQHDDCSTSACSTIDLNYLVPLSGGNVANLICVAATGGCSLITFIGSSKRVTDKVSASNCECSEEYSGLQGWPIHEGGFLLNYLSDHGNVNNIVLCDSSGVAYQKVVLDNTIQVASVGFISNGYLMNLWDKLSNKLSVRMYKKNVGWLPDIILSDSPELMVSALSFMQPLPQDKTLLVFTDTTYPTGIIINSDGSLFTGGFLVGAINRGVIGQAQRNGDVFLLVFEYSGDQVVLSSVSLPTSLLNRPAQVEQQTKKRLTRILITENQGRSLVDKSGASTLDKTSSAVVSVKSGPKVYPRGGNFSSVRYGTWDKDVKYDHNTGEPIFTYRVYDSNNAEVGTAEFYAHPLLCFSEDKQRNNVIKTTGVFSELNFTEANSSEEICRTLPPTLFDRVVMSAAHAAAHGAIRGGANVVGFTLSSFNVPENIAYCVNQFTYYGAFFTMRFGVNYYQSAGYDSASRSFVSFCKAAIEMGEIMFANFAFNALGAMFHKAGEALENRSWPLSGKVAKVGGSIMRFGVFAFSAVKTGFYETSAALFAGAASEIAVETSGTYVVSRCRSKQK